MALVQYGELLKLNNNFHTEGTTPLLSAELWSEVLVDGNKWLLAVVLNWESETNPGVKIDSNQFVQWTSPVQIFRQFTCKVL